MDVLDRLELQTGLLRAHGLKRVWILTLAGWLTSCASSTPPSTTSAPESFNELKQRISLIRELSFKREVALAKESPNATRTTPERIFSDKYGSQSLVHISHAYKRLGLLPESTDFPAALADYVRLDRIFYYDARRDLIVISPDATQLVQAMRDEPGRNLAQLPVVLALSRALQEQHFQWQGKLNGISLEDRRLAFRALAVGDTVLVGSAYLQGSQGTTRPPDSARNLAGLATALEKMGSHLPQLLQQKLVFPYREGAQFVQWAHAAKGWTGVECSLCRSASFRPRRFFTRRSIMFKLRKSAVYPRFRLGTANEGKRHRRSDFG